MYGIQLKEGFSPPVKLKHEKIVLEVLAPKHNELDYEAWNSSLVNLRGIFGPRNEWPSDVLSLNDNLRDLENHLREFNEGVAYTYSLLSSDEKKCIGCLYIRPSKIDIFDCRVDFWFRDSHKSLEVGFYQWLKSWLELDWGLSNPVYPGRTCTWVEYYEASDE